MQLVFQERLSRMHERRVKRALCNLLQKVNLIWRHAKKLIVFQQLFSFLMCIIRGHDHKRDLNVQPSWKKHITVLNFLGAKVKMLNKTVG